MTDRLAVGGEQRGAAVGQQELVQVSLVAVAGVDLGDLAVLLVVDLVVADAVRRDDGAFEPRHDRLTPVALHAEVERPLSLRERA